MTKHANSSMRQADRSRSKCIPIAIFNTYDLFQETLKELFPSWEAVERYEEVVLFVAGLMKDSRPLVQYLYEMQVEDFVEDRQSIDAYLLKSLHAESTVPLPHPLHNKYINYYNHYEDERKKRPSDTTPVYFPSRLYEFRYMRRGVVLENHFTQGEEIPPCVMHIDNPNEAVMDTLLSTCSEIWKHQGISQLYMWNVTCNNPTIPAPRLTNPGMVVLWGCNLQDVFIKILLRQLFGCGETLQELWLNNMNLRPFESLLDELLEDLVAHHEAGLAQRKLDLELRGYKDYEPTNLSEEFKKKWRNRCEKIDSIVCMIYDL